MIKAKGGLQEIELRRNVEMLNLMNAEVIANLESAKFGLTETQRKKLFHELIALDRRKPPEWDDARRDSERLRIFKNFGIHKNLYWEITNEGSKKGWPRPEP